MTVRLGPKGQVVVPKVVVLEADGEVRIRRPRTADELLGLLGHSPGLDDLAAERAREGKRDAALGP